MIVKSMKKLISSVLAVMLVLSLLLGDAGTFVYAEETKDTETEAIVEASGTTEKTTPEMTKEEATAETTKEPVSTPEVVEQPKEVKENTKRVDDPIINVGEGEEESEESEEPEGFQAKEPSAESIPVYYEATDISGVWHYYNLNKEEFFRVYGTVDGLDEGFYNATSSGELIEPITMLVQSDEERNAWGDITPAVPAASDVPEYYAATDNPSIFTYKMNDGNTYYRIYGEVKEQTGYYACESDGTMISAALLDQQDEKNNAYNSATESTIIDDLVPGQSCIDELSVTEMFDGTAPWDNDDNAGNDSGAKNKICRSFDSITYMLYYKNILQNQTQVTYFKNGKMYIRFELPCTLAEARFDIDAMTWLEDAKEVEVGGKVVLTGYRQLTAGEKDSIIPGEGELSVVVKVLGMENQAKLQPTFIAWMDGNDNEHGECKTAQPDVVTISAAPSYNIQLKRNTALQWKDSFNFASGNSGAVNRDAGTVKGRMYGYGVTIQLRNIDPDKKLKGIELPQGQIKFNLNVQVTRDGTDVTGTGVNQYMPLLWDYKVNSESQTGSQGRKMFWGGNGFSKSAYAAAPFGSGISTTMNNTCVNSGIWDATQMDKIISVTVDAYEFLTAKQEYNWVDFDGGNDYNTAVKYGEAKGIGCFSAGYIQIVMPEPPDENANYYLTVSDDNMWATSVTNQIATNADQTCTTDDSIRVQFDKAGLGSYDKNNYTTVASQTSPTPYGKNLSSSASGQSGDAWTTRGATIELWGSISNNSNNDLEKYPFAVDILQKFDDEAFQPLADADGSYSTALFNSNDYGVTYKLLYAAKPDGSGWNNDAEMSAAVESDLVFFESMAALKTKYPTGVCVAVLIEGRGTGMGIATEYVGVNTTYIGFNVNVLDTAELGKVYQMTNTMRIWTQEKGSMLSHEDSRLSTDSAVLSKLNDSSVFLNDNSSVGQNTTYGPYVKAVYDESGNVETSTHAPLGSRSGVSVLIVGNEATITKSVNQVSSGKAKESYDVSAGQRRVDYVLSPVLKLAGGATGVGTKRVDVVITDILPKGISVSPTTQYYLGGTYTTDNSLNGGLLNGGTELALAEGYPQLNGDGTTTLKWVIPNVLPGEPLEKIHFSASIGVPGDNEKDVINGQQLTNTVMIQAGDDGRSISTVHGNKATNTIKVSKLGASSLTKMVKTPLVEMDEKISYEITHNNMGNEAYQNYSLMDILPANNDGRGSKFDGSYTAAITASLPNAALNSEFKLYITNKDQTGVTANTVNVSDYTEVPVSDFKAENGKDVTYSLPAGTTAYYMTGRLDAKDSYKVTITLTPSGNKGGNVYANDATACTSSTVYLYAPTVTAVVIQRAVKGIAWYDANYDGIRSDNELLLPNIKVSLWDAATDTPAVDVRGNTIAAVKTDSNGAYEFSSLKEGTYIVKFEGDNDFVMSNYMITKKDVATNVKRNSKAEGVFDADGNLESASISGITLPDKTRVSAYGYTVNYQDIGLLGGEPAELVLNGAKTLSGDKETKDIEAGDFTFTITEDPANDKTGYTGMPTGTIAVKKGGNISFGTLKFLKSGSYNFTLAEVDGKANGYTYDSKAVLVSVAVRYDVDTGKLITEPVYSKDGNTANSITFANKYELKPISLAFEAKKELTGKTLTKGAFSFELKSGQDVLETAKNDADGNIKFSSIQYTKAGQYIYTISEKNTGEKGMSYDTTIYQVTVDVIDNDSQLEASATITANNNPVDTMRFVNVYAPKSATANLTAQKIMLGRALKAGEFSFELKEGKKVLETASNDTDGNVSFRTLVYDTVGTHTYTISEKAGSLKKVTYDASIYTATVDVVEKDGNLEAAVTIAKDDELVDEAVFTNKYKPGVMDEEYYNDLTVEKAVDKTTAKLNDILTYTITASNNGDVEKENLTIKDYIPEYTSYVSSEGGELKKDGDKEYVEWVIDVLEPGESVTLTFKAKVTDCLPSGTTTIPNTAIYGNDKKTNTVKTTVNQSASAKPVTTTRRTLVKAVKSVRTGDATQWMLYLLLAVSAIGTIVFLRRRRRKQN